MPRGLKLPAMASTARSKPVGSALISPDKYAPPVRRIAQCEQLFAERAVAAHRSFVLAGHCAIEADRDHANRHSFGRQRDRHLRLEAICQQGFIRDSSDGHQMAAGVRDHRAAPQQAALVAVWVWKLRDWPALTPVGAAHCLVGRRAFEQIVDGTEHVERSPMSHPVT